MTLACKYRNYFFNFFHYIIFVLFMYAAFSKTLKFDVFVNNLGKSPFFENINISLIAIIVIALEYSVPFLLFFEKTAKFGYLTSFVLFLLFSGYIVMLLQISPYLPCSCGGFTEVLSWTQHIYFNIFFLVVSVLLFLFSDNIPLR
ncbi:MauE/DoxX family redox-associated membrane protein [Sphingobacterium griseoflavum]|uniref:MauE/DoxX family redox-associated membrane protein n=1 Tax=Sphingobacterium griseoflavum TaxID=1474952 RepID=UPI0035711825